ncbi:hypothetical protein KC902_00195 [Candidatus Kaiserbacteria bacterium]|nr:hypothetical protein [Candidatus Kaiserbacteria bacterium]USN88653.1 MAG: hypothetical protein H6780_04160 [Candidatus Nomurabacteria bacterium]
MIKTKMKRGFTQFLNAITIALVIFPLASQASDVTVRPFLIDRTLLPRDTATETITIKSDYDIRKAVLFATVNEITLDSEGEIKEFVSPVMTDRTNTITSWIEVSRGRIEVPPGETVEVPLTVRVHPQAQPGEYTAFIGLVEAANRDKAEAIALAGEAKGVLLKVTVSDQRKETMSITSFMINRFVTGEARKKIEISVENKGDITSAPAGEIIFYDSRGREVDSVTVKGEAINPGEMGTLTSVVPLSEKLGRFKANVTLHYGDTQQASLFDTTYFYLVPMYPLLMLFGIVLLISIAIALMFRRAFFSHESPDDYHEVTMYVRDGHEPNPQDHDIDLKQN